MDADYDLHFLYCGGIVAKSKWGDLTNCWSDTKFNRWASLKGSAGLIGGNVETESALRFNISFAQYPGDTVTNKYRKLTESLDSDWYNVHFIQSTMSASNATLDQPLWVNNNNENKVWKKGDIHPELVSYQEYLTIVNEQGK